MLNIIFSFIALAFLLGLVAYVLVLVANNSRILAINQKNADLEAELLKARIEQIMAQKRLNSDLDQLSWNGYRKFEIISKVRETEDITSFYLAPHDGKPVPEFLPGQHLTFQVQVPGKPKPAIRCYSLSDSPFHPDRYRVTIKRIPAPQGNPGGPPGLVSGFFHDSLKEKDIVDVKAPSGHFVLDMRKNNPVVLIAGGVGLTPLLSMLNTIAESGSKRETWLFLGVRNRKEHLMKEHLESLDKEYENIHLQVFYSRPEESAVLGQDHHHEGRISVDKLREILPSNNYEFHICAPPPMIRALRTDLEKWGVPKGDIHFEAFGSDTVKKCQLTDVAKGTGKIEVTFSKSRTTLVWDGKMDSLLDFAEEHSITIESGCRAGNCGTCLTAIKSGNVAYVGEAGLEPEKGSCLPCISIPSENLTLDA